MCTNVWYVNSTYSIYYVTFYRRVWWPLDSKDAVIEAIWCCLSQGSTYFCKLQSCTYSAASMSMFNSCHSFPQFTMFTCCAVIIAIIQYSNFCQLSFWMRSSLATLAGLTFLSVLWSPPCRFKQSHNAQVLNRTFAHSNKSVFCHLWVKYLEIHLLEKQHCIRLVFRENVLNMYFDNAVFFFSFI